MIKFQKISPCVAGMHEFARGVSRDISAPGAGMVRLFSVRMVKGQDTSNEATCPGVLLAVRKMKYHFPHHGGIQSVR